MSDFMDAAKDMRNRLGHSLCLAKWKQVSLHLTTGHTNSCYHPAPHRIPVDSLSDPSALHNTEHKKLRRKEMLEGARPSECSYCWNIEDKGHLSDRHYRSGEPWAAEHFDEIVNSPWDKNSNPSYVEVNFNNACNLRCSYCSPQFSSSWMAEVQREGAYPTSTPHNDPAHFSGERRPIPNREDNPYVEAFWRWWPDLYPELRHFRMTGGEPLMDRNTFRVFDYVLANPKSDLHLAITSNFSVEPELFENYLEKVKLLCRPNTIEHFMQYVSVDSWGAQAEYIRHGLDFERLRNNVERYLTEVPEYNSITFIITMNNLVVPGIRRLLEWILDLRGRHSHTYQRVWFDTPILRQPAWQQLSLLPEAYAWKLEEIRDWMADNDMGDRFVGFKDYEIQRMSRTIDVMRKDNQDEVKHMSDFYKFFTEHDRRRRTNFLDAFPEMSDWWTRCEHYAKAK